MDFGRVNDSALQHINFKLPKEPLSNRKLSNGQPTNTRFNVGLSKWGRKEWIGLIYPKGTMDNQFLNEYSKHFNSIELNASHYKLFDAAFYKAWVDKTEGSQFSFCPKVYQGISHIGSLNDKQFLTDAFLLGLKGLGKHLGPIFLQVSDKFSPKRKDELINYLKALPKEYQFFLEVRHPDWFENKPEFDKLYEELKKINIGLVIVDTAGRRDVCHMTLTIPKAFIRFVGNNGHPTDYRRLDDWVDKLLTWKQSGISEVYFFIHNHDEGRPTIDLINYFLQQLNDKCNAGLQLITFQS